MAQVIHQGKYLYEHYRSDGKVKSKYLGKIPGGSGSDTHIKILVPSTINIDNPITEKTLKRRVTSVVLFLRKTFGGSTRIQGIGNYHSSEKRKSITENVVIVESFFESSKYEKNRDKVFAFLLKKKKEWGQESLTFGIETPAKPSETLFFV